MTLSWKELVCHGLLNRIEEPVVVKNILKMVMRDRCAYLSEEVREFHTENVEQCLHYIRFQNMFARGEEVILSELPPRKAIMLVISHNKVIYELKYSWKEIVLKFRKKRRERRASNLKC